jgi:predicted RNase H-like HicB family nuclease
LITISNLDRELDLTIVYEPGEDDWIIASIPEVSGVFSQGRTREEARENVLDALKLMLSPAFGARSVRRGDAVGSGQIRLDSGSTAHPDVVDLRECWRKLMRMERREYDVMLVPEAEGGFSVFVPDLPSVATQGETVEEALDMARDTIEGYLEIMRDEGWPVPTVRRERVAVEAA